MKILVVTTDEPFYIPLAINELLKSNWGNKIIGIVLLPPTSKKRSWYTIIKEQLNFGCLYFLYRSVQYIFFKLLAKLKLKLFGRFFSVDTIAKYYGVKLYKISNINSNIAVDLLSKISPDIIVSISASQIFSKKIIDIPKYGAINVHNAPLPKYRGLMPSFWILKNNEPFTAITVHKILEDIDSGDIIVQKKVPIAKKETLDSCIKKTKLMTADALVEAFELIEKYNGNPPTLPNNKEEATYFGFPSRLDVIEFKKMGRKLLWKGIY